MQTLSTFLIHFIFSMSLLMTSALAAQKTLPKPSDWQEQVLPEQSSFRASASGHGSFWVAGTLGKIFRSIDNGTTWQDVSINDGFLADFRDLEVFDAHTAIVMSAGSGHQSRLYITTNGGKTWKKLLENSIEQAFYNSIAFWDRNNGLIFGDPVDGYYHLQKTTDGGKTWRRILAKHIPTKLKQEAAFAASGNTLISVNKQEAWITTGGFSASAYYSNDQGETWQRYAVPIHHQTATAGGYALAQNRLNDIFVVGGDYQNRGGVYANIAMLSAPFTDPIFHLINAAQSGLRSAMQCAQSVCVITGKLTSDYSVDDGKTWLALDGEGFYTLTHNNDYFLAAGHDGRIGVIKVAELLSKSNTAKQFNPATVE